jgi:hypothetical protein
MRISAPTRALSLFFSALLPALLTLHCAGPDPDAAPGLLALAQTDPEECRSFAATSDVRLDDLPAQLVCSFDVSASRRECQLSTSGASSSTAEDYASAADFVEAGHHMGKLTSLSETRTENGATGRTTHKYDELGRLVRSLEERPGASIVHAYADYDAEGRPRQARLHRINADDECADLIESIEYAAPRRTVSRHFQALNAARCGFAQRTVVEHYDARGNQVSIDEGDGAGVATRFEARRAVSTQRVCL